METLLYNSNGIRIITTGTSKFMFVDRNNEYYTEYDYVDLDKFIEDTNYIEEHIMNDILSILNDYFVDDYVSGDVTFNVSNMDREKWHQFLRDCNNLSREYSISYKSKTF